MHGPEILRDRTKQVINVLRNIGALSCNRCCSGKAVSITHSECVFETLGIQHAMRMSHIVVCDVSGYKIQGYS